MRPNPSQLPSKLRLYLVYMRGLYIPIMFFRPHTLHVNFTRTIDTCICINKAVTISLKHLLPVVRISKYISHLQLVNTSLDEILDLTAVVELFKYQRTYVACRMVGVSLVSLSTKPPSAYNIPIYFSSGTRRILLIFHLPASVHFIYLVRRILPHFELYSTCML